MRNLYLFEKLLVVGLVGFIVVIMVGSSPAGMFIAPIFVVGLIGLYVFIGNQANTTARAAVAHVNNSYVSAREGTAIGLAYAKGEDNRPVLQVFANGKKGYYAPQDLRSVGLHDDRKGNLRNVLLKVKDPDRPEWIIHFNSRQEATQWKERIMQFAETCGRG